MSDSYIARHKTGGVTFVGGDATELVSVTVLRSMIHGMRKGLKFSISQRGALDSAARYTGRNYKRSELALAEQHLTIWIETMRSALPVVHD